jgi:hypothetical protein
MVRLERGALVDEAWKMINLVEQRDDPHAVLFLDFLGPILLFGPRREHSSVPATTFVAAARQGLSRLAQPPEGLGFDSHEHGGTLEGRPAA